jgi:endogenous inhibitor of DNA gyrase (YacG/DUF329 family)
MEIKNNFHNKILKISKTKLKCPNCKKKSIEPYTPFCSKKCSDLDLMKWLVNESYINLD